MPVTIIRRTGVIGMLGVISIKINGKKVEEIRSEQQIDINFPSDKARLKVSQFGIRSNELEINDGETIKITISKWMGPFYLLLISLPFLTTNIPDFQIRLTSMIIYVFSVTAILFGKKWYQLNKL